MAFLRVEDIKRTILWYEQLGFKCLGTHQEPGCELDWALLDWHGARFMLYPEGSTETGVQREAGLYFTVQEIDSITAIIIRHATVIDQNPKTAYDMKEIVFKDCNGFQVTFGCTIQ